MKKLSKIFVLLFVSISLALTSCQGMLDVRSDKLVFEDENYMKSDSLYSIFGILSQLQKLADSYVILGELRGDLLETQLGVNKYLEEIYYFDNYSNDNPYTANKSAYYSVINNCNYVINNVDVSQTSNMDDMIKVKAAATGIKAWTYMQMVLNFKEVCYFEKPILTISDAEKEYPTIEKDELFHILINELLPYKDLKPLRLGSLMGVSNATRLLFPTRALLGDLYLWTDQYERAANEYHDLIYENNYTITTGYRSYRETTGIASLGTLEFTGQVVINWMLIFEKADEFVSQIAVSNQYELNTELDNLFFARASESQNQKVLTPTKVAINYFDSALYFEDNYGINVGGGALTAYGDMRKYGTFASVSSLTSNEWVVAKYYNMNNDASQDNIYFVVPYRIPLLYLRYAEAVNRLGKPNLAMAVLKDGLNRTTLNNRQKIPATEVPTVIPNYMDFTDTRFENNIGVRSRGLGNFDKDTTFFVIATLPTQNDSVLFVENLIQEELALELAYEGNRFHDLMRFAIRRNDEAYLANIVSSKFEGTGHETTIRQKLLNRENWYVK